MATKQLKERSKYINFGVACFVVAIITVLQDLLFLSFPVLADTKLDILFFFNYLGPLLSFIFGFFGLSKKKPESTFAFLGMLIALFYFIYFAFRMLAIG